MYLGGMLQEEVRRAYDGRASWYNAVVRVLSFGGDTEYRRRAVAALGLRAGDRVLDVGCGTGLNFRWLAREVGPTGMLVGADACRGMLRQVTDTRHRVQATASQQVFKEGTFDAVLSTYVISTLLDEWFVGPGFMLRGMLARGWPDLRRATMRAMEPHFRDLAVSFCHFGMIYIISGVRR